MTPFASCLAHWSSCEESLSTSFGGDQGTFACLGWNIENWAMIGISFERYWYVIDTADENFVESSYFWRYWMFTFGSVSISYTNVVFLMVLTHNQFSVGILNFFDFLIDRTTDYNVITNILARHAELSWFSIWNWIVKT